MAQALMVAGTLVSASSTLAAGKAANRASQFEATQLEARAREEVATSSRAAAEEKRRERLASSRALAVGAASGGGTPDGLLGDIAAEGEYRALAQLYEGEERAREARASAAASRFEGESLRAASRIKATSTLLDGASSFFTRYGGGGPPGRG